MAIVTVDELKQQLNLTADLGTADDALLGRKLAAAQNHVERLLGFKIAEEFEDEADVPPALVEAIYQLAALWYEERAAASGVNTMAVPYGLADIVREHRRWSFDG
jgi:hypothetical protein